MRTLLLADDNTTIHRVIALTFADEAFRIVTVSDGQAAIDAISARRPDIVLAGTNMPNVNGYEVAQFVRSRASLRDVPVLLLTGAFEQVDPDRLKASGANGVLEKPLEPTIVISRVKELLGLKGEARPTTQYSGPVTPADTPLEIEPPALRQTTREAPSSSRVPRDAAAPLRAAGASSWDEPRETSGLEPDGRPVDAPHETGRDGYSDSLDAALDSLDQQLAGRGDEPQGRPPSPRPDHYSRNADPHSPSGHPNPPDPAAPPANPVFEVDDDWFAEGERASDERRTQQEQLAAEMGIFEVDLPETPDAVNTVAPAADLDFDFDLDDAPTPAIVDHAPNAATLDDGANAVITATPAAAPDGRVSPPAPPTPAADETTWARPVAFAPMPAYPIDDLDFAAPGSASRDVADDFATLLAFEQGEHSFPSMASPAEAMAPVVVQGPPLEITDAMLGQIAERLAERLSEGLFADQLRQAMTTAVRDTVRSVISETSERLVRDEIARVKAQAERETQ